MERGGTGSMSKSFRSQSERFHALYYLRTPIVDVVGTQCAASVSNQRSLPKTEWQPGAEVPGKLVFNPNH